ncbi:MAG: response regulator [Bacteroidia bacterium]
MSLQGPILIIDDKAEEHLLMKAAMEHLEVRNPVISFLNGKEALDYLVLSSEVPFLIFCDMDMPVMDGMELRRRICADPVLKKKSIPFVFHTGSATSSAVDEAYEMTVQGVFRKPVDLYQMEHQIKVILTYWRLCIPVPL